MPDAPPTPTVAPREANAAALRAGGHAAARALPLDLGGGLRVRRFVPEDAPALFARIDADRAHLGRWLEWVETTRTPADTAAFLRDADARFEAAGALDVGLEQGGALVGVVGTSALHPDTRTLEVGYWLAAHVTGRGIVTRALRALEPLWFDVVGLARLEIHAHPDNAPSRAVAERAGYRLVGVREAPDAPFDPVVYVRTAPAAEEAHP